MNNFFKSLKKVFTFTDDKHHLFRYDNASSDSSSSSDSNNDSNLNSNEPNSTDSTTKKINSSISENQKYLEKAYNTKLSTDIVIRNFNVLVQNVRYKAFLIFIDGMVDSNLINDFVLSPLMLRNKANSYDGKQKKLVSEDIINNVKIKNYENKKISKSNLTTFVYNNLLPQNSVKKVLEFSDVFSAVNMGDCVLFIDTIEEAYDIDVKGFKQRSIEAPTNEVVVRGSQESFVENLRTNTSILRRLINNENLVLESIKVGKITKTNVSIGYINGITNKKLVAEVKYRINNLDIDYLISSGQLEQLIQDNPNSIYPQMIATERPDKVVNYLFDGRVCILVNGSPYALVLPGVFVDFLSSPADFNLKYQFANLGKIIRLFSLLLSVLLPGMYIAVTNYHHELLPTELLFTIAASRESVPFPIVVEILLMEISFELIREAGVRVPTPLGPTIGIVGAIVLGDAAVSASLVSPILIIIVAITGICSFAIPDFSLNFTFRICRFLYIILGYLAGFLGIAAGIFVQMVLMCNLKTFGADYLDPIPINKRSISTYFVLPIWKRERKSDFVRPQKKYSEGKISMKWRYK
ncbi:MAG: spore germination protein [Clostridia bacterium]|nr:spore germination protein [Clostridia bacterium]